MTTLKNTPTLTVGKETLFAGTPYIVSNEYATVTFGNFCSIAPNLKIIATNHDYNYSAVQYTFYKKYFNTSHPGELNNPPTKERTKGNVIIGNDVWIGEDVVILSGVKIGDGCCIGARSIVTKDLESYTICAGTPCKSIKYRYDKDMIEYLLQLKWWNWSDDTIKQNKEFFHTNLNNINIEQLKKIIKSI